MLIYTHIITARSRYIFKLLFAHLLEQEVELTDNLAVFEATGTPKLVYTNERLAAELYIQAHPLLAEVGLRNIHPDVFENRNYKAFFAGCGDLPFDIFAASFYLLSRYEEYFHTDRDQFQRFQAKNSLAFRHGFLHQPVINYWLEELKKLLAGKYPLLQFKSSPFTATMSFDIDVAYAYKGRGITRNVLSACRNLLTFNFTSIYEKIKVLGGKKEDPFDSYSYIQKTLVSSTVDHIFFFLLAKQVTAFDRNIATSSPILQQLVRAVASFSKLGIHPSYYSSENNGYLRQEKQTLERILNSPVTASRQHYLRFKLPETYVQLLNEGITDDYSMGYAELPGFRAGICTPFLFYNLLTEEETSLTIHPITYMEGSFIEDMKLDTQQSIEEIKRLIATVKEVNGAFLCIWHNHTLSDYSIYKGWRKPYEETLRLIKEN